MRRWLAGMGALILFTGCAHTPTSARFASTAGYVCKHCNCFMPADVNEQAMCPVCNCRYPTHACRRGR